MTEGIEYLDILASFGGEMMPVRWNLRLMMAQKGIWTGVELQRRLEEQTGLRMSSGGISRLLHEEQSEIKLRVLDAICTVLECQPSQLIVRDLRTVLGCEHGDHKYPQREGRHG